MTTAQNGVPFVLDGTEQQLFITAYQFAAGARVGISGGLATITTDGTPVPITGRLRVDSITGTVIESFTATLSGKVSDGDSVQFAFTVARPAGSPVPAHRVVLTVQSAAPAPGTSVAGRLDVSSQGV